MAGMLSSTDSRLVRYQEYEQLYLSGQSAKILRDDGKADLAAAMEKLYQDFKVK